MTRRCVERRRGSTGQRNQPRPVREPLEAQAGEPASAALRRGPDHRLCVAPMMEWTDRHCRNLLRLIAPHALLYTEMIVAAAIEHGDAEHLLRFDNDEHPVALQIGGSDPRQLALAAQAGAKMGYDEINLNVGCPSGRVQAGRFGVCLMREPALVADCVAAMRDAVNIPVTVKTRIGVDNDDSFDFLLDFVSTVAAAGCDAFVIHARKAWLKGLSPRENREVPPLDYAMVRRLKRQFPSLPLIVNGGIDDVAVLDELCSDFDGVMIGRAAYQSPMVLAEMERRLFPATPVMSRSDVVEAYLPYMQRQLEQGERLHSMTRHMLGLFQSRPGARHWRRQLSQVNSRPDADINLLKSLLADMANAA
ncbi:MAG: tRNA dihydrouridine(20/20a) synthase DusA [Gammaproteobacteria bacterium]|nr:tRNA dihydrouridine(20/20a) synthase DusA [Gammaproteobacteria bacterium]